MSYCWQGRVGNLHDFPISRSYKETINCPGSALETTGWQLINISLSDCGPCPCWKSPCDCVLCTWCQPSHHKLCAALHLSVGPLRPSGLNVLAPQQRFRGKWSAPTESCTVFTVEQFSFQSNIFLRRNYLELELEFRWEIWTLFVGADWCWEPPRYCLQSPPAPGQCLPCWGWLQCWLLLTSHCQLKFVQC